MLLPAARVGASPADPAQWPDSGATNPDISGTPNTIRFSGGDRYQTNLALSLATRGTGNFPFDTSDRTVGGAATLADAHGWWGAGVCPRSIIVVAGDTFADALAASALSDPNDRSSQPRLQRVAAADPLFDPIGGFDRPDTASAPIIVTASARSGATSLSSTARLAASDLAKGGCTTARAAIIVGGNAAVPTPAEGELISVGYSQVFRVAGADRYETAARIATALGTEAPAAGATCVDPDTTDGTAHLGFYANGVVEFRSDASHCRLLSRSVVLADGGTGADALAAGWLTAQWQVPLLLTAPDGTLPDATRVALQQMRIDSVILLGGVGRIPESTADEVRALTGAAVGRFSGTDRYATSLDVARKFGGWWSGPGTSFAGDMVCVAGSIGNGPASAGWPDALAAGPFCGSLGATRHPTPTRALAPVAGTAAATGVTGGLTRPHDAVPIILVPPGDLPDQTRAFLAETFGSATPCTGDRGSACVAPGFAVVVGGPGVVPDAAIHQLDAAIGGTAAGDADQPTARDGFVTALDMAPVFTSGGGATAARRVCFTRGSIVGARWLSVGAFPDRRPFVTQFDVRGASVYRVDADGVARSPGANAPACVQFDDRVQRAVVVAAVGVGGAVSDAIPVDLAPEKASSLTADVVADGSTTSGPDGTTWHFESSDPSTTLTSGGTSATVSHTTLDLTLTASTPTVTTFAGTFALQTSRGPVTGSVTGEAIRIGTKWELRGRSDDVGLAQGPGTGGFRGTFTTTSSGLSASWSFDAVSG